MGHTPPSKAGGYIPPRRSRGGIFPPHKRSMDHAPPSNIGIRLDTPIYACKAQGPDGHNAFWGGGV
jgi:hypothetical protein